MEVKARNVNDAFVHMVSAVHNGKVPVERRPSRYGDCLTIPEPVMVTYHRPTEKVLFNPARDCNPFFHVYEALWMLAGRNDVAPLRYYNERMAEFSDDGETFNAAYGYRWRNYTALRSMAKVGDELINPPGSYDLVTRIDQLDVIAAHLISMPDSRRAVLSMWNVEDDLLKVGGGICPTCEGEWTEAKARKLDEIVEGQPLRPCPNCSGDALRPYLPAQGSKDVACNTHAYFTLRRVQTGEYRQGHDDYDGPVVRALDITVCNRSNDLTWGMLGANAVQFSVLLEYMAARLGAEVGVYNQFSNNVHCYVAPGRWEPEKWLADETHRDMHSPPRVDYNRLKLVPLVQDPERFDEELTSFVALNKGGISEPDVEYDEPFFRDVGHPMCQAFHQYKEGDLTAALKTIKWVKADDWRIAGEAWLQRRLARRKQ